MILPEDLEYHTPADAGHTWAETYFIAIALPEEHMLATVYVAARPGMGAMLADVGIWGALSDNRGDMLHIDQQAHLPAPARFSDIQAQNGLSIKACRPPRDYRIGCAYISTIRVAPSVRVGLPDNRVRTATPVGAERLRDQLGGPGNGGS